MSSAPYKYEYEYEYHTMRDAALPIMYHEERLPSGYGILTNWHENLEILWFTKGLGRVIIDNVQVDAEPGDLVFINSNCLHRILSIEDVAYYCLIIDRSFCLRSGIPAEKVRIQPRIRDGILRGNYKQIIRVLEEKPPTARPRPRPTSCCSWPGCTGGSRTTPPSRNPSDTSTTS